MVEVGGIMQNTPLTQVTEEIVCHNFAHRQSASNDRCKEAECVTLAIFLLQG